MGKAESIRVKDAMDKLSVWIGVGRVERPRKCVDFGLAYPTGVTRSLAERDRGRHDLALWVGYLCFMQQRNHPLSEFLRILIRPYDQTV